MVTQDDKPLSSNAGRDLYLTIYYYYPYVPPPPPPPPEPVPGGSANASLVIPPRVLAVPFVPQRQEETQVKQKHTLGEDGTLVVTLNPPSNASSMRIEVSLPSLCIFRVDLDCLGSIWKRHFGDIRGRICRR